MSTITTLNSGDSGPVSRGVLNTNLSNLNADKAELASPTFTGTPTLPTDTVAVTQSPSNNSTRIATTAYVDNATRPVTIESTSGATHSLTTIANQTVMVWASGQIHFNGSGAAKNIALKYNGVTKHTYDVDTTSSGGDRFAFSLMYTETPGAATEDITVEGTDLSSVVIMVLKLG